MSAPNFLASSNLSSFKSNTTSFFGFLILIAPTIPRPSVPAPDNTTKSSLVIFALSTQCFEQAYGSIRIAFSIGTSFGTE